MYSTTRLVILIAALAVGAAAPWPTRAVGAVTAAGGWAVHELPTPAVVQGGVVRSGDAVLVGQGAFGPGLQGVIRLQDGVATTVATGFNSLGGFALDATGTLYVVDNGGNVPGAITGDTVFAIPDALTRTVALAASGAEVLPPGAIPFAQDVVVDGTDLLVSDGAGPGAGRVLRVRGGAAATLVGGLDYAAGLALDGGRLLVGNVDGSFAGSVAAYALDGAFVGPVASGLSGSYAHALDTLGNVLVTGGFTPDFSSSTVVAVPPGGGTVERARGFAFSSEIFHDAVRDETLVLDFGVSAITAICRDADVDGACDADVPCTGGVAMAKAKLALSKLDTAPGDDALALRGELTIPPVPPLDPSAHGARVVVSDATGTVASIAIPPGAYDPVRRSGWKVNGSGTSWTFVSRTGVAGIRKVGVKRSAGVPGLVKVTVKGRDGAFPTSAAAAPLRAVVALRPSGQCGAADFSGPAATCVFASNGSRVRCR